MATPLDMSLEDVIKKNNREKLRARGRARRGRGAGGSYNGGRAVVIGSVRRGPLGINARPSAFSISKPPRRMKNVQWQHDLFEDSLRASGISGIEIGTKLYVSNLDYGVTKEDIRELFSEIGDLKRFAIHYDKNGRPSGSAEVVYTRRSDAFAALKRYNNVLLDGKPMKIEMLGDNADTPVSARINVTGVNGRSRRTVVLTSESGRTGSSHAVNPFPGPSHRGGLRSGRGRGRGRGGWSRGLGGGGGRGLGGGGRGRGRGSGSGRGRGQGRKKPVEKSSAELDKELENYHAEAMQT
ncbi:THO complex subunit 4D-like [Cucurbita moschata]|uniref:THO complex subunit 4D-like n=1 Tax=Cucurbita moschata TaxID=3662 RepID=A0A6J1FAB9_CUCMO|nr:THO complex subunit 4D-like [Cucurbita moschata]XP_022935329.1 THO complex subunit 4D-like [Cucurbita moschata]XP_022935330.1 THO complex subunit 4D-like [Cucurbita moschata]